MPYVCEFAIGQRLYLDNQGPQTIITVASSQPGQQQQATSRLTTGVWIAPPEILQTPMGLLIKLITDQGEVAVQMQGSSFSMMNSVPSIAHAQTMQMQQVTGMPAERSTPPMQPMQPMQPMKMGDMQMDPNSMQMRMGNLEMQMGSPSSPPISARRFCSQCGGAVKPDDRFCSSCGHRLG